MADIVEGVSERLNALAVVCDGGVTLNDSVELVAEVDGVGLPVVVEEIGDGGVESVGRLIFIIYGEIKNKVVN
jgi:hypothetical protein